MDSMMFALLMLTAAFATSFRFEDVPCPYGEGTVRKFYKVSGNTLGGHDSDLAVYSTRGQFRTHAISTCPSSFYSVMGTELDRTVPPEKRTAVDAAISAARQEWVNKDQPTVWERYDTAARIATAQGRDALSIGELYLMAAWTARDAAVGVYVGGLNGPSAAREILTVGSKELSKSLTPEALKLLRYNLARVAHRGGFSSERDIHVDAFLALASLTPEERTAGKAMKHLTQQVEPRYQAAAAEALARCLTEKCDPTNAARARYQLGDTYRRLGKMTEAKQQFQAALGDTDTADNLKELAVFLLEEIGQ
jgi:tetratricopeptide (TPR) repeat protein